jgi:hypothetical protein
MERDAFIWLLTFTLSEVLAVEIMKATRFLVKSTAMLHSPAFPGDTERSFSMFAAYRRLASE